METNDKIKQNDKCGFFSYYKDYKIKEESLQKIKQSGDDFRNSAKRKGKYTIWLKSQLEQLLEKMEKLSISIKEKITQTRNYPKSR